MARPSIPEEQRRTQVEVVRVTPDEQAKFNAAVKILGGSKSVLLHVHILDLIEKAKLRDPERFDRLFKFYSQTKKSKEGDETAAVSQKRKTGKK